MRRICSIFILSLAIALGAFSLQAQVENRKMMKKKAGGEKTEKWRQELTDIAVIPQPLELEARAGVKLIGANYKLQFDESDEGLGLAADYLEKWLSKNALEKNTPGAPPVIELKILDTVDVAEGYYLRIAPRGIRIYGSDAAGVFYGIQSMIQLSQPWQYEPNRMVALPFVNIKDRPKFSYRGMHLDVGRHMFPVEAVKSYIDMLARYKMNRFHWHLTEDQGWRIEIKQYPKLQEVAAYRDETLKGHYSDQPHQFDGQRYGGYYTQEEVKEVVEYAKARFITVIPEIEMPGHAQAAIAAYPELGCTGQPVEVATKWGIFENVYCPSEATFTFLENVLTEVMALFPSKYIHIGGDECPKAQWEESALCQRIIKEEGLEDEHGLQSWFIQRMEQFLNQNGRQIIGWDEILEGGLAPNATVMSWRGEAGGIEAAKQGHDVIMTPTSHCYFDYYQSTHPDEPLAIGGYLPLEKVYNYHPVPKELSGEAARHVLGAQGNLWTEYIPTAEQLQYMAYPRMQALAEVVWLGKKKPGLADFVNRLVPHLEWMDREGINAANHLYDLEMKVIGGQGEPLKIAVSNLAEEGRYKISKVPATGQHNFIYYEPFEPEAGSYTAECSLKGKLVGRAAHLEFEPHLGAGQQLNLESEPHPKYNGERPGVILNGVDGSTDRYGDEEWLGFEGKDFKGEIELKYARRMEAITFRFFHSPGQWVYAPKQLTVQAWDSEAGAWKPLATAKVPEPKGKIVEVNVPLDASGQYQKLQIEIPNYGTIEQGKQGAGHKAWLFVDEIRIN